MNRLRAAVLSVGLAAAVLTGCSKAEPPKPDPSSSILPAVTLPAGSTSTGVLGAQPFPRLNGDGEEWDVPLSFEQVKARLTEQLPIGRMFDGVPYESEEAGVDKLGGETILWYWAYKDRTRAIIVGVTEFQPKRDGHTRVLIYEGTS